jgi:hypothetical protein
MADVRAVANGNFNTGATWNTGTVPTAADDVYSNTFTVNVDVSFTVLTLRSTAGTGITAGGSFNFNTAGVTGTVTSSSPLVPGATNLIQVTATTGTVTISLGGNVTTRAVASDILINYSGNCNLNLTGTNFNGGGASSSSCINKTSAGLITITGNVNGGNAGANSGAQSFVSTNGNTVIIGNVTGGIGAGGSHRGVNQSAGTLTITGNVTGGQSVGNNQGVLFSGTSLTVNGTILGGTASVGIETSAPINNVIGNVTGGINIGIATSLANIINVTGTVTASATAPAIQSTNANGQVYLNGNMVNNNGKMAIYAPIVWLDANNTTSAAFFTSGGSPRTLYSEDTFPNMPAEADTRDNIVYGPGSGLRGTLKMPAAADTRNGVVYDNGTTGTALFTTATLLSEMGSSTTPVAVRMRNCATPEILGEILEAFKK